MKWPPSFSGCVWLAELFWFDLGGMAGCRSSMLRKGLLGSIRNLAEVSTVGCDKELHRLLNGSSKVAAKDWDDARLYVLRSG